MRATAIFVGAALALAGCQASEDGANGVETVVETENDTIVDPDAPTANDAAPVANESTPSVPSATLSIAPDGIAVVDPQGRTSRIDFGADIAMAERAASATLGEATGHTRNEECGAGPMAMTNFPRGLTLNAQGGKFVGWSLSGKDAAGLTMMNGTGIGTTRAEMETSLAVKMVPDSTLGAEFTAGELSGLLTAPSPAGKVETLWAGTNCIFR